MDTSTYTYNLGIAFYNIAKHYPDNTALRYPSGKKYTYREVNITSNKLANLLLNIGLVQGDVVAIFNDKSVQAYSLMLACLKTGILYTNLDTSSPWQRISKIMHTCNPNAVFYDSLSPTLLDDIKKEFSTIGLFNLQEEKFLSKLSKCEAADILQTDLLHGNNAAYIMFTSGSTGFPKGATMSHNNVLNFIRWGQQTFSVTDKDVFTNANPIYFDNSVFDFYTSLFSGATLVPLGGDVVKNPQTLVKAVNESQCTIWFSVPSLLVYLLTTKSLTKNDFLTVKRISFGGEGFPKTKLKQLYELFGDRITLFNVYGPTECTCICSSYIITKDDFENMTELAPLGNIAPNFGYEIFPVDEKQPNLGELALSGPCVGLGYYNDSERTQKSFIQNPTKKYRELLYKTGDLVEKGKNSYLYFKGRLDNQIKHMGYRIELEEIESALNSLTYVNEAGVIYEKLSAELGQIKAYVSLNDASIKKEAILADVKNILPQYMVPKSVNILDSLPKNTNGKIDRRQLMELR